jgi:hypothetical protein
VKYNVNLVEAPLTLYTNIHSLLPIYFSYVFSLHPFHRLRKIISNEIGDASFLGKSQALSTAHLPPKSTDATAGDNLLSIFFQVWIFVPMEA